MNIGLFGYGAQGQRHAHWLKENGHTPWIHDPLYNESKTPEEIFDECGAVIVATPNKTHHHYVARSIIEERPCLVEKPMTVTFTEAQDLCRLQEDFGTPVMVCHNERFNTTIQSLADLRPIIGSVTGGRTTQRQSSESLIQRLMVHDIDLCNWLYMGSPQQLSVQRAEDGRIVALLEYIGGRAMLATGHTPVVRKMGVFTSPPVFVDFRQEATLDRALNHFITNTRYGKPYDISVQDGANAVDVMEKIEHLLHQITVPVV